MVLQSQIIVSHMRAHTLNPVHTTDHTTQYHTKVTKHGERMRAPEKENEDNNKCIAAYEEEEESDSGSGSDN